MVLEVDAHEKRLVEGAVKGNRSDLLKLFNRYESRLYQMVYKMVTNHVDAEDVTQEAFFQAFRSIGNLRDHGRFKSWLYQIAANKARDLLRVRSRRPEASLDELKGKANSPALMPARGLQPIEYAVEKELIAKVQATIASLQDRYCETAALRFGGFSETEIANILKIPIGTVRSRWHRIKKCFRQDPLLSKEYLHGEPS